MCNPCLTIAGFLYVSAILKVFWVVFFPQSVIRDAENVAIRGTRSTKFHLRVGQFKSAARACYQVISETHPSESQCSVARIGQFNVALLIHIFGVSGALVELKS